ncbi:MAG: alpha-amylase [Tenericutes bacterium]|nr:alpha-amylase [Mycoplasmatota bacterium]
MKNTKIKLRNLVIYQIYVRNFSKAGTFKEVIKELDRIKDLGVDVVYLLPIHPIGEVGKKGSLGCPYSIKDYRAIASELGTMEDFQELIDEVHERKMKIMMDVVYNHSSNDSVLLEKHPEYFYRNALGEISNKVEDWSDVSDFEYANSKELWVELTDILVMYSEMGVDAYRCDVASLVPRDFWKLARKKVSRVNRGTFWLSESVHGGFCKYLRDLGHDCMSESEIYEVFDMAYDYDVQPYYEDYLYGKRPLKDYLEAIKRQEEIYPSNYVKMKNLENHDFDRIAKYVGNDLDKIKNWTALNYFQKGAVMLYAGEEFLAENKPSLFEKELFHRNGNISEFIKKLNKLKKKSIFAKGIFDIKIPEIDGVAYNTVENETDKFVGIFNVGLAFGQLAVDLEDGRYRNYLNSKIVHVTNGLMDLGLEPIILRLKK